MSVAIIIPSRGRPNRLANMMRSCRINADGPISIYVGLDQDDAHNYHRATDMADHVTVRPRQRLSAWTNTLAEHAIRDGHRIIGSLGDDSHPRTRGWDLHVEHGMDTIGSGLVYTRDGIQDERLPTTPFWSADIIQAAGFYSPTRMAHMYLDNYWLRLAQDLGRVHYLPRVLVEHMHPSVGKNEPDALNEVNDASLEPDRIAFEQFLQTDYPRVLERVRACLTR